MSVQGTAGTEIVLEASVDFANWTSIVTNEIGMDGTLTVCDPASVGLAKRFYRMRAARILSQP